MTVRTSKPAAAAKSSKGGSEEISWQAQKSAMTRDRILDAAISCFIDEGYTNVTTAKVASTAGVSRGAMLHHFPSKTELIQATVEYLHQRLLDDYTERVTRIPIIEEGHARRRAGLDAYWDHLTGDLAMAYHELCVAGRTDPELKDILAVSSSSFARHVDESNTQLFSEWADTGDRYLLAMDITRFMMEGMALGQLTKDRSKRIPMLLDYLADRLDEIFEDAEGSSAITRHSSKR